MRTRRTGLEGLHTRVREGRRRRVRRERAARHEAERRLELDETAADDDEFALGPARKDVL